LQNDLINFKLNITNNQQEIKGDIQKQKAEKDVTINMDNFIPIYKVGLQNPVLYLLVISIPPLSPFHCDYVCYGTLAKIKLDYYKRL
jgi:hypothetical protein